MYRHGAGKGAGIASGCIGGGDDEGFQFRSAMVGSASRTSSRRGGKRTRATTKSILLFTTLLVSHGIYGQNERQPNTRLRMKRIKKEYNAPDSTTDLVDSRAGDGFHVLHKEGELFWERLLESSMPTPPTPGESNRLIAYVANWRECPTDEQIKDVTHIIIAFAVTYTWAPDKNQCRSDCSIGSPVLICENENKPDLVEKWKAQGKKVIFSFGGAGMGGSWEGDVNDCWENCFGKEASVVRQLDAIVRKQNFDGVNIDYEYFYDSEAAQFFLGEVTRSLRSTLPKGSEISHVPMDTDIGKGGIYYEILKANADYLNYLAVQFYNGNTRPAENGIFRTDGGWASVQSLLGDLVNDIFRGNAKKVVFGFCVAECAGSATGWQASMVMKEHKSYYPCNGGAFYWVAHNDPDGLWQGAVSNAMNQGQTALC